MTCVRSRVAAVVAAAVVLTAGVTPARAAPITIDFEGFAPAGGLVNINPGVPYLEDGYRITVTNALAAVFDANGPQDMLGNNNSSWFGFEESNVPTLTLTAGGGGPFDLIDVLLGPSTISGSLPMSITVTGHVNGGGTVSQTFTNLSTATLATLNFTNLNSVDFTASDDAALDNIRVQESNPVPVPAGAVLFGLGMASLGGARLIRRRPTAA